METYTFDTSVTSSLLGEADVLTFDLFSLTVFQLRVDEAGLDVDQSVNYENKFNFWHFYPPICIRECIICD